MSKYRYPQIDIFLYSHHLSSCYSVDVVRRNSVLVTHRSKRVNSVVLSDTDCCTRQCCGPGRPFEMRIVDNMQREVMHLSRPVRCQCCWLPCCLQEIEIQAPPGTVIGYVQQKWWYKIYYFFLSAEKLNHSHNN